MTTITLDIENAKDLNGFIPIIEKLNRYFENTHEDKISEVYFSPCYTSSIKYYSKSIEFETLNKIASILKGYTITKTSQPDAHVVYVEFKRN